MSEYQTSKRSLQNLLPKLKLLTGYFYHDPLNKLLFSRHNDIRIQLDDQLIFKERQQFNKRYYFAYEYPNKINMLSQYYKYHTEVPRIFIPEVEWIMQQNYQQKRQIQYENVSKKMKYLRTNDQNSYKPQQQQYSNVLINLEISSNFFEKENGISFIENIQFDQFDDIKQLTIFHQPKMQKNLKNSQPKENTKFNTNKNINSCHEQIEKIRKTIHQVNNQINKQKIVRKVVIPPSKSTQKLGFEQRYSRISCSQQGKKLKKQKSLAKNNYKTPRNESTSDFTPKKDAESIGSIIKKKTSRCQLKTENLVCIKKTANPLSRINKNHQQSQMFKKIITTKKR